MLAEQKRRRQKLPIKKKSDQFFESPAAIFLAFGVCFRFLSQVYLEVPTHKFMNEIFINRLFFDWPVAENQEAVSRGLKILQDYSCQWQADLLGPLKQDHTRLFIGLERILAPPYASVYLSEEHLLFEKPVLDVRRFYKKIGLQVNPKKREPDDHIGFEMYCLCFLCENVAQAGEQENTQTVAKYQTELREFLSDHLNSWLYAFLSRVTDNAQTPFYNGVALLTLGLIESLGQCLDS